MKNENLMLLFALLFASFCNLFIFHSLCAFNSMRSSLATMHTVHSTDKTQPSKEKSVFEPIRNPLLPAIVIEHVHN